MKWKSTLILLTLFWLAACGNDNKAAEKLSQREALLAKESQWQSYKNQNQNNYKMTYRNRGFNIDTTTQFSIEVQNDALTSSSSTTENKTMDQLFDMALSAIDNQDCSLGIHYFQGLPVIKDLTIRCGEESHGVEVLSFEGAETVQNSSSNVSFGF